MTTVFLTEKPSQARDIAAVIGVKRQHDGYIELVTGELVVPARGHLLRSAEPKEYDESWGQRWNWGQLPMVPSEFKYHPEDDTKKQLGTIRTLLKTASKVVVATDAGREGELIAGLILEHCRYRGPTQRFWTSSLTPTDIKRALAHLLPGSAKAPLLEAAKARQFSDWVLGYNGTRGVSLAANVSGEWFPIGRVQTPTLAMAVRRRLLIETFGVLAYYELEATVKTAKGESFKMMHSPSDDKRITDKKVADALKSKAVKFSGPLKVEKANEQESPPLPYSLPALQKDANRIYGFTAKNTLKLAQALYEKAKVITYPRTDCQHLAKSQTEDIPAVTAAIAKTFPTQVKVLNELGVVTRASTFDDSKLSDHHGIVPTALPAGALDGDEMQLYTLICTRYLQTLSPDCKFLATRVSLDANGVLFKTSGKTIKYPGWHRLKQSGAGDDTDE
jgi:DNA topoisomerase-3